MDFSFVSPQNIYFGCGKINILSKLIDPSVSTILVVISKSANRNPNIISVTDSLKAAYDVAVFDEVSGEPTVDIVNKCTQLARKQNPSLIISIGGGSVIDTAKATAGFARSSGNLIDYIEGVGTGKTIEGTPICHIAIPTTSGTGSEMTKNAVIKGKNIKFKRSLRHDKLVPIATIIDPNLIVTVSKNITAYSGMDAITQLIESYISTKATPFTDALALEGLKGTATALLAAYNDGSNVEARERMAYASMISGMCLANSGLGAVHGIGAGLGATLDISHGMACAILLPKIIKINAPYIEEKSASLCNALTGACYQNHEKNTDTIISCIDNLIEKLHIPTSFNEYGITKMSVKEIIENVSSSSMSGNPCKLSDNEILDILLAK